MNAKTQLSETAVNVVENLASRVAERSGGRITANHLAPYLPMSLGLIKSCLDNMADGSAVLSEQIENGTEYEFTALRDTPVKPGPLAADTCISCAADLAGLSTRVICGNCMQSLKTELNTLAETTGWPAQAVYEHEILHIAANSDAPLHADLLATHSRYTLRNMRRKLDKMSLNGFVRQELDTDNGLIVYQFPAIQYSKEFYRANVSVIRSYPASVMEEVELKLVRILLALAAMVLVVFVLAFLHVPPLFLLLGFAVAAPVTSVMIWRHRDAPEQD